MSTSTSTRSDNPALRGIEDFVLITGFSGAGKSQAMAAFEDAGYFCVDNLPPEMISSLAELFAHEGSKVERAAVVCDVRGGAYFEGFARALDELDTRGLNHRVLFLEASDDELIKRFHATRRRHPLEGPLREAIEEERRLLDPIRARADERIDTSALSPNGLRRAVAAKMMQQSARVRLTVTLLTFGSKYRAPPHGASLVFDVRFLPNPHWVAELRELTGLDAPVAEYVEGSEGFQDFYDRLRPMLDFLLPRYAAAEMPYVTIAIGCTGGRHRSVAIAERLARDLDETGEYNVEVSHLDIDAAPQRG